MATPAWAPTPAQVAVYVPHRTLVRSDTSTIASQDQYEWTFTDGTLPTDLQVDQLAADGCAWVTSRVFPLNVVSEDAARVVAALYAAAGVERGWPEDDRALTRATDLEKRLDTLLSALVEANAVANGADGFGIAIVPQWSYPPADQRYDYSCYW